MVRQMLAQRIKLVHPEKRLVLWFEELRKGDVNLVGGKNANLGELTAAKIPVPPGFAITAHAYRHFIRINNLDKRIALELRKLIDPNDTRTLKRVGATIRRMVMEATIPKDLEKQILDNYDKLGKKVGMKNPFVAVRSSATAEDLPGASFAGQQETYLNVKGDRELLAKVKECIASLFTDRAIFYRILQGFAHSRVALSVAVQKMANSKSAGVMFTINPATGDDTKIVIEGTWGLGEAVVSGSVTPDHFVIDKKTLHIIERDIVDKKIEYVRDPVTGHTVHLPVPPQQHRIPALTDEEIKLLASYGLAIEKHYGNHQDIEWAIDRDFPFPKSVFIVQARPETVWVKKKAELAVAEKVGVTPILKGLPASPGAVAGVVKIVPNVKDIEKVKEGDILITRMTTPDWVPAMRKAKAIVTEEGGSTCIGGDTKILTNKGFMSIKDVYDCVENKKEILFVPSLNSSELKIVWKPIKKAHKRIAKKAYVVSSYLHPTRKMDNTFVITPEHKIPIFDGLTLVSKDLENILERGKICIADNVPRLISNNESDMDGKLFYLGGAIFSDGHIVTSPTRGPFRVSFCQKNTEEKWPFTQTVCQYFHELFGGYLSTYDKNLDYAGFGAKRSPSYWCSRKLPAETLFNLKQQLLQVMLVTKEENIVKFLAGFADGDGCFNKEKRELEIYLDKKDKNMLEAIVLGCLRLGIVPRVSEKKSMYVLILRENVEKIIGETKRIKGDTKEVEGVKLFSANILKNIPDWRGSLWRYRKDDSLIDPVKLLRYVQEYGYDDYESIECIKKLIDSHIRMQRIKKISELKNVEVYNLTVDANNDLDHNYVAFTKFFTPVIIGNCHAAIVSRELGIPCIVGTGDAMSILKDGAVYTIDAREGYVYEGVIEKLVEERAVLEIGPYIPTQTKIYMNLGVPEKIQDYKKLPFDGIGLMRLEFIIASYINEHPLDLIAKGKQQFYIDKLAKAIETVAKPIRPKPVVVRFSDFKTNEYKSLPGGEKYEPKEDNPMIGWRGVSRYISGFEEAFRLECRAIKKVREKMRCKNVWVMLPFVRTTWEVEKCLKIIEEEGLKRGKDFKVWFMLEVPSVVFMIDEFSKYCDGFSIGSNDLTQLILGADRDSEILGKMGYFDERNPAVQKAIRIAVEGAKRNGKTISLCGQAPSVYPEFAEFLVKLGVTSMSINPDTVSRTRKIVAEYEKKHGIKK